MKNKNRKQNMSLIDKSSFKNALNNNDKDDEKDKEYSFIIVEPPYKKINIKAKIVKWLMTDMGDDMVLFDFILLSFEEILQNFPQQKIITSRKEFLTRYINWIYKNSNTNFYKNANKN